MLREYTPDPLDTPICDGKNHYCKWTTTISGPSPVWDGLCRTFGAHKSSRRFFHIFSQAKCEITTSGLRNLGLGGVYFQPDPWGNDPI